MNWRVEWEMADIHWAAAHEHVRDFTEVWDIIPWIAKTISRETPDEASARQQYETLRKWEREKSQPIRNVKLFKADSSAWKQVDDPA